MEHSGGSNGATQALVEFLSGVVQELYYGCKKYNKLPS